MRTNVLVVILVTLACGGCATQFMGTAAAQSAGSTYVAGSASNEASLWLCPTTGGECKEVEVSSE